MRFREHRKLLSGRMSGRNRAEQLDGGDDTAKPSSLAAYSASAGGEGAAAAATAAAAEAEVEAAARKEAKDAVPPLREDVGGGGEGEGGGEGGVEIEWWDDAFLTKEIRDDKVCMCSYTRKGIHLQGYEYVLCFDTRSTFGGRS